MAFAAVGMHETLANVLFSQQCQEKQSLSELLDALEISNAHAEFRRALKELIRDHLNTCMSLTRNNSNETGVTNLTTNCSTYGNPWQRLKHVTERCNICRLRDLLHQDDEEEGEQHLQRQHVSASEEPTEASAARRRQSRILNRLAAREAQEMLTSMERQAQEADLLSLAGMHSVSTRDSSFLREPSPIRSVRSIERPSVRASSLLQMWRELEGGGNESGVTSGREGRRTKANHSVSQPIRGGSNSLSLNVNCVGITGENERANHFVSQARNANTNSSVARDQSTESANLQSNDVAVNESSNSESLEGVDQCQVNSQNNPNHQQPRVEQSPRGGDRERVRQIVQRWMSESRMIDPARSLSDDNEQSILSQRGELQSNILERPIFRNQLTHHERRPSQDGNQQIRVNRNLPRLRGRQAYVDLLMRIARERKRELERLVEHQVVSQFPHRNRIQALLRGRFLRSSAVIEEHSSSSSAAGELGQLRERRTVTCLRDGFASDQSTLPSAGVSNRSDASSENQPSESIRVENDASDVSGEVAASENESNTNVQHNDQRTNDEEQRNESIPDASASTRTNSIADGASGIEVARSERQLLEEEADRVAEASNIQNIQQHWQENNSDANLTIWQADGEETVEVDWNNIMDGVDLHWEGNESDEGREWQHATSQGVAEWHRNSEHDMTWHENPEQDMDGDWQDHLERETTAWDRIHPSRTVTVFPALEEATSYNDELRELLGRRSVSTVLASDFRERMDRLILSYVRNRGRSPLAWDSEEANDIDHRDAQINTVNASRFGAPPPPPPPPPPAQFWRHEMQRSLRSHALQRSEPQWEVVNEMRAEIATLQQGIGALQRMLETCMEMQLELQRSVRQEVSAALNRSSGEQVLLDETLDGSKWVTVRKGICCICCDKQIDSLLYRCGHMCTCLRCANELNHNSGKCPMCRAPIVEVVRAYCQM